MKKMNQKGFTLIELMIVIAIIGILAAIAIPNYIAYRDKAFCSAAESDAQAIASGLADYFAVPAHTTYPDKAGFDVNDIVFESVEGIMDSVAMSGDNMSLLYESEGTYRILVMDASGRCPDDYKASQACDPAGTGDCQPTPNAEGWSRNAATDWDDQTEQHYFRKIM